MPLLATSLGGLVSAVLQVLIFMPPAWYARWVGRERAGARAGDGLSMAGSAAFEAACAELERSTSLDRWAARGTLQLTLMDAGLETGSVSAAQLGVVIDRLLPRQLQSHGIADAATVCARLREARSRPSTSAAPRRAPTRSSRASAA